MSDRPDDPFGEDDPRAAEREARRRAREERRRKKGVGARKSLADRVSGAIGGGADQAQQSPQQPPQAAPPPEPQQPQAPPTRQQPAAEPTQVQPQEPQSQQAPAESAAPRSDDDWLSDLDRKVETGEWLTEDAPAVAPAPQQATPPPAAPTPAHSAQAPAEPETGAHTDDWETYGSVPQTRAAGLRNLRAAAAAIAGGGGGGRAEVAQAGGRDPEKLDDALAEARRMIEGTLG